MRIFLITAFCALLWGAPLRAHTGVGYVRVFHSGDDGPGSLRAAILHANEDEDTRIVFQIPITDAAFNKEIGVWTLAPLSPLPPVRARGTVFEGNAQTQILDSNSSGPEIRISGAKIPANPGAPPAPGLILEAPNCRVQGLDFADFKGAAMMLRGAQTLECSVRNNVFTNNARGDVVISGGASANEISGNEFHSKYAFAIRVAGRNSRGNTIRNNRFSSEKSVEFSPISVEFSLVRAPKLGVTRLEKPGVFHEIWATFEGAPRQKYALEIHRSSEESLFEPHSKPEIQTVEITTGANGQGRFSREVRGYPAGSFAATVSSRDGQTSEFSAVIVMPYLR